MSMMSTSPLMRRVGPALGVAVIISMFAGLYPANRAAAWGALCGGLGAIGVMLLLRLRGNPDSTMARSIAGTSDERDKRIVMESGAWTAKAAYLACPLGMVAIVWHADPMVVIGAIMWSLIAVQLASHWWLQRHR